MSLQRGRNHVNGDFVYQLNTGKGLHADDTLRYDLAYAYRFYPAHFTVAIIFQWEIVGELNGQYHTDGFHTTFLSPGLKYSAKRWVYETSLQIPVFQDQKSTRPETNYRIIVGIQRVI